nr:MAG TPA: hypothetical protein [Caudoviricetes sp.]
MPILHACVRDWGSDYVLKGTKEFQPLPSTAQGPARGRSGWSGRCKRQDDAAPGTESGNACPSKY